MTVVFYYDEIFHGSINHEARICINLLNMPLANCNKRYQTFQCYCTSPRKSSLDVHANVRTKKMFICQNNLALRPNKDGHESVKLFKFTMKQVCRVGRDLFAIFTNI